jgi:uncharacterized protein (DUF433 family)
MSVKLKEAEKSWIQKSPGICGGDTCIRDTRVPVWSIIRASQRGTTFEQLQRYFVTPLSAADVQAALDYYREKSAEIDEDIRLNDEA